MRTALIPPRGLENYALQSNFHLALAIPGLMSRRTYSGMYLRASRLGDYVVLDNGANEGTAVPTEDLVRVATDLQCQEIVMPDVLADKDATIRRVREFVRTVHIGTKKMAVLQGKNYAELRWCVSHFADIPEVTVIGIPRHIISTVNKPSIRIDLANEIENVHPKRFEIHFLGTNPQWLREVCAATKYAGHVRSVDSSLPFNYTIARKRLSLTGEPVYRPTGFFEEDWSRRVDVQLLKDNIETFLEWTNADIRISRQEAPAREVRGVSAT